MGVQVGFNAVTIVRVVESLAPRREMRLSIDRIRFPGRARGVPPSVQLQERSSPDHGGR